MIGKRVPMTKLRFRCSAVEEAARLILEKFAQSNAYTYPMRFALAIGQRVCFKDVALTSPSLDIGVNDGSTACLIHYGKPRFSWGGDMPEESTYESMGLYVAPEFNVYDNFVGLNVADRIPFADESFNTISSTEVFSYGIDRETTLAELVRVLAPGGTLAFSENSEEITRFPALMDGLKQYVPSLDILEDARAFYEKKLAALGMTDIVCRYFFDRSLAAFTHSLMYAYDPTANPEVYRRLVIEDPRTRRFYTDGLMALAAGLDREFSSPEDPPGGWHIFVSCRKPGVLNENLPVPRPVCPDCLSPKVESSLLHFRCRVCAREHRVRFGVPYLLRDPKAAFSPKQWSVDNLGMDRRVHAALSALYPRLKAQRSVWLFGVDQATRFTVLHLRANGVAVEGIVTTATQHLGKQVEGVPVLSPTALKSQSTPLLVSGYIGDEGAAQTLLLGEHR